MKLNWWRCYLYNIATTNIGGANLTRPFRQRKWFAHQRDTAVNILSNTEPIRILRNDFTIQHGNNLIIYLVAFSAMFVFLGILFQDIKLILYIAAALIVVTVALYIVGRALIYCLGLLRFSFGIGWKIGLKNIIHRGNESVLQIIIFGLSLLFLIVLAETRTDLIDSWSESLDEDTPNYFLFNIQEYDTPKVSSFFESKADISLTFTPLIRGRLLSAKRSGSDKVSSENLMEREANLTWLQIIGAVLAMASRAGVRWGS